MVDLDLVGRRDVGLWAIIATVQSGGHGRRLASLCTRTVDELKVVMGTGLGASHGSDTRSDDIDERAESGRLGHSSNGGNRHPSNDED